MLWDSHCLACRLKHTCKHTLAVVAAILLGAHSMPGASYCEIHLPLPFNFPRVLVPREGVGPPFGYSNIRHC